MEIITDITFSKFSLYQAVKKQIHMPPSLSLRLFLYKMLIQKYAILHIERKPADKVLIKIRIVYMELNKILGQRIAPLKALNFFFSRKNGINYICLRFR